MWYLAHAYQHTRLREIASPARCSSFLLCCYPNKEPIKMIGKKNYTYLTKDQPYQRLAQAPLPGGASVERGVEVHVTGDVENWAASGGCPVSTCSLGLFLFCSGS